MRKELFLKNIRMIKFAVGVVISVEIFIALVITFAFAAFHENMPIGMYLFIMIFLSVIMVISFFYLQFYKKMNYDFTLNGEQVIFFGLNKETNLNRSECEKIYLYSTCIQIKFGTNEIWLYNYKPSFKKATALCVYDESYLKENFPNAQIDRKLI